MARLRRQVRVLGVIALAIAACAPSPSTTPDASAPGPPPRVALSCWTVPDDECRMIFEAALARVPAGRPVVAARVTAYGCESGPCAPGILARGQGEVLVEFGDGGGLVSWQLGLGGGGIAFTGPPIETRESYEPESQRGAAPIGELSLGHCGLFSPIDFDGSFWDPVGPVDGDAPEAIGGASGTIRLLGPIDAEFLAASGFTVRLRRHEGAKTLLGCD